MNCRSMLIATVAGIILSLSALAQEKPLPKPVSPPLPIPGSNPPAGANTTPVPSARGAEAASNEGAIDPTLAPFIDAQTIGVLRVDLKDLDLKAITDWTIQGVDDLRKSNKEVARGRDDVAQELGKLSDQIEKLRAAGIGRIYVVVSLADILSDHAPAVVVPLEQGADAKAVEGALEEAFGGPSADAANKPVARTMGHAVVLAVPATFDQIKAATPIERPELASAFEVAGKAELRLALIPQEQARKQVESVATGDLPGELGGKPIKSITRGLGWMTIALSLPPSPELKIVIQASGVAEAKTLDEIIHNAINWAADRKTGPPEELAFTSMLAALKPQLEGDRITIDLGADETRKLAATLAGALMQARNAAASVQVASHLRQLSIGIMMYTNDHNGQLPKDLGTDVQKYLGADPQKLWTDPLRPNEKKPYVYLKLADKMGDVKDPADSVMIYENHTTWDAGINVAFADGHVEWVVDEKQFKAMLDQTKRNNPQAAEMPQ